MRISQLLLGFPAALILSVLFGAYAVFFAVGLLTAVPNTADVAGPVTLDNYARFLFEPSYLAILWRTLWLSTLLAVLTAVLGYPVAYFIARTPSSFLRRFMLGALVVTMLAGSVSRAYSWLVILGNRGLINSFLLWTGLTDKTVPLVYNELGVSIALVHFLLPFFVLTVFGAIKNLPTSLEESARNLGAGRARVMAKIVIPLTFPAIAGGLAIVFSLAMSAFVFPLVLGGGRVRLLSNFIYDQVFVAFDRPFAAAVSLIFLVVALTALMLLTLLQNHTRRLAAGGFGGKGA
ncbi:ABC transporter permease [Acuticoccus mangrovi]|uniref:ABC transporter permease n=1 Tax=Acuticoccus mangrovi TaxID=2796142 RepID=A0A934IP66_9HYPH|nr:ABC transporter permease [Acuticoccus mangrovi]MBJ3776003.1 ABC transporter permease [Acuticoccus mangrovi]